MMLKQPCIVYTEATPNPAAYRFVFSSTIVEGGWIEVSRMTQTDVLWLDAILQLEGVLQVYMAVDFITVIGEDGVEWSELSSLIRDAVFQYGPVSDFSKLSRWITRFESMSLEQEWFVRQILPLTGKDGGGIYCESVNENVLHLRLAGACKGCPYINETLRKGIFPSLRESFPHILHVAVE